MKSEKIFRVLLAVFCGVLWLSLPVTTLHWPGMNVPNAVWSLVYLGVSALALFIFSQRELAIPLSLELKIFLMFIVISFLTAFYHHVPIHQFLLDGLTFFLLICIFRCLVSDPDTIVILGVFGFLALSCFALKQWLPFSISLEHQNHDSEYIAASAVFCLFALSGFSSKISVFGSFVVVLSSLYMINRNSSRAALLAFLVGSGVHFYLKLPSKKLKSLTLALAVTAAVLTIAIYNSPAKIENTSRRLIRWGNTIAMIKDNPVLGVGPGQFEFGYLPYRWNFGYDHESGEEYLLLSPHNGFLELISEYGLISFLLLSVLLVKWLFREMRFFQIPGNRSFLPALVFFSIDAFFAFPMELGPMFYFAGFLSSGFLRKLKEERLLVVSPVLITIMILGQSWLGWSYFKSYKDEVSIQASTDEIRKDCERFPNNWKTCVRYGRILNQMGLADQSEHAYRSVLQNSKHNFVALRDLNRMFLAQGQYEKYCATAAHFDFLFNGGSSERPSLMMHCIIPPNETTKSSLLKYPNSEYRN